VEIDPGQVVPQNRTFEKCELIHWPVFRLSGQLDPDQLIGHAGIYEGQSHICAVFRLPKDGRFGPCFPLYVTGETNVDQGSHQLDAVERHRDACPRRTAAPAIP
jgi:hypothetical protein